MQFSTGIVFWSLKIDQVTDIEELLDSEGHINMDAKVADALKYNEPTAKRSMQALEDEYLKKQSYPKKDVSLPFA